MTLKYFQRGGLSWAVILTIKFYVDFTGILKMQRYQMVRCESEYFPLLSKAAFKKSFIVSESGIARIHGQC